jgi:hypothetical protein
VSPRSSTISPASAAESAEDRVAVYNWQALAGELSDYGCAVLLKLLSADECRGIVGLYSDESHFRSHVHMARHGFGKGEYRYFKYPLPQVIGGLRTALYPHLATIANEWNGRMAIPERYPATHASFLKRCHDAGQARRCCCSIMQSRAEVVPLRQGDAVAFAVHNRPVQGSKGNYRVNLRHGVSRVRSGMRHTVGIIFHDAA